MIKKLLIFLSFCPLYAFTQSLKMENDFLQVFLGNSKTPHFEIDIKNISVERKTPKVKQKIGSFNYHFKPNKKLQFVSVELKNNSASINYQEEQIYITAFFNENNEVELLFKNSPMDSDELDIDRLNKAKLNYWHIPIKIYSGEIFYGGGIQFSNVVLNNNYINNLTEENGIGRGDKGISKWTKLIGVKGESYSSYSPQSYTISNMGRALRVLDYHHSSLDFQKDFLIVNAYRNAVILKLQSATTFQTLVKKNNLEHQKPYQLPDWALGNILGLQGGTAKVSEKLNKILDAGAHVDAIWIQDWVGKRKTKIGSRLQWRWKLDTNTYPDFEIFKSELNQKNIKLLAYINPFFDETGEYALEGIEKNYVLQDEGKAMQFQFGAMKGYMLDIFNPEAYNWMKNIIQQNIVNQGFSGWMADFAEYYPIFTKNKNSLSKNMAVHNAYAVEWAKLNWEIINENKEKELMFFNRSGNEKVEKYSAMMWCGDQTVNFAKNDGLPSVFVAMLSSGMSNMNVLYSDIGGYTSIDNFLIKNILRSEEVLTEWMKMEAFTPVFRTHEGLHPDKNLQSYSNQNTISEYKIWSEIHHRLVPYFKKLITLKHTEGTPIYIHPKYFSEDNLNQEGKSLFVGKDIFITYDNLDNLPKGEWLMMTDNGELSDIIERFKRKEFEVKVLIRKDSDAENLLR
jgi:sulfoquinovosidase